MKKDERKNKREMNERLLLLPAMKAKMMKNYEVT